MANDMGSDSGSERFARLPERATGSPDIPPREPGPMTFGHPGLSGYTVEGEIAMFGQLAAGATEVRGVRGLVARALVLLLLVLVVVGAGVLLLSR